MHDGDDDDEMIEYNGNGNGNGKKGVKNRALSSSNSNNGMKELVRYMPRRVFVGTTATVTCFQNG